MATKPDKNMSSRLMTMKFMQRAATSTPSSPSTPQAPPHKRQRLSNGSALATQPATPSDRELVDAALEEEEARRVRAVERVAREMGETRWVLDVVDHGKSGATAHEGLRVVSAGFGVIDGRERGPDAAEEETVVGRKSYGRFKDPDADKGDTGGKKGDKSEDDDSDDGTSSSSASSDDEEYDPVKELIRQERRAAGARAREERKEKKRAAQAEADALAFERRKKNVKLNKLTSISGGGNAGSPQASAMVCFACGQKGHAKRDCPQRSGGGGKRGRGAGGLGQRRN